MPCLSRHRRFFRTGFLAVCLLVAVSARAQEKSINPEINKPYQNPDVSQFIGRFEVESREVFAHRKEIVAACRLKPGMVVGDIGAGTGLFTRLFAAQVGPKGSVFAVDVVPKFIEHIRKTCREGGIQNVQTVVCKPDSVQLPANSIDVAFICDTYHHFEFPQKRWLRSTAPAAGRPGFVLVEFRRVKGTTPEWLFKHVLAPAKRCSPGDRIGRFQNGGRGQVPEGELSPPLPEDGRCPSRQTVSKHAA